MTALVPVLFSTGGLGLRLVDASAWTMHFWRSLFMALTLIVLNFAISGRRFATELKNVLTHGIWVSIFISLSLLLYVLSLSSTTVADSLLVQTTGPLFIVVLGWIVLKEPVRLITVLALLAVTVGVALILVPSLERGGFSGNVLGILKAVAFAGATIAVRRKRSVGLLPAVAVGAIISTVVAIPFVPSFRVPLRSLAVLLYLGIFQTGMAFTLHVSFSGRLASSQTGLLVLLEGILGSLWVWIFLGEVPAALTLLGGMIIVAALVVHTLVYSRVDDETIGITV